MGKNIRQLRQKLIYSSPAKSKPEHRISHESYIYSISVNATFIPCLVLTQMKSLTWVTQIYLFSTAKFEYICFLKNSLHLHNCRKNMKISLPNINILMFWISRKSHQTLVFHVKILCTFIF